MDLRRLKHLVTLADARNFGRAAELCHLSQPAFSRSIQAAEEEYGLQLFDRGHLEVTCTDAGAFIVERARKLLFDSRCLERDVDLYRERLIGDLAFGVGPYVAGTLLPPLLTQLRQQFPGVRSRVTVNNTETLSAHLRAEELDFYVADLRQVVAAPDFTLQAIGRQHAAFYVRAGHPLLARSALKLADLLPYGLASVRIPQAVQAVLAQLLGPDTTFSLAVECDSLAVIRSLAETTDTVIGYPCPEPGSEAAQILVRLDIADLPLLFADMGVVSLKGRSHSPMALFAIEQLTRLATKPT